MEIDRVLPRVQGNNAQASQVFNDQTRDRICPGRPPASIDRAPVCVLGPATLPAEVYGQEREVVVNNFDLATSHVRERAGVEHSFDRVETIGREDRACDQVRMAVASNGNRATACDPTVRMVVPTVVPTAQIVDPVIAGPI
jgi:hypothetical protein